MAKAKNLASLSPNISAIKCLLIDLDGTLYVDQTPIIGAQETIDTLKELGYVLRFLTNTTTKSRAQIARQLAKMDFNISDNEIITAPQAAVQFLKKLNRPDLKIWPVVAESVKNEFSDFKIDEQYPDYLVVGYIGTQWNYALLDRMFNCLLQGSQLIALHKNRYWQTTAGLHVDIGLFVAGLEYTTGTQSTIIGKPAKDYYLAALQDLGAQINHTLVIGDDIESDIGGAQQMGLRGILVKTGKYRSEIVAKSAVSPDAILDSIAQLPKWLTKQSLV